MQKRQPETVQISGGFSPQ